VPLLPSDGDAVLCSRQLHPVPFDLQPVIGSESLPLLQVLPPSTPNNETINPQ
jgi:hypothetical protein